MRERTFQTPVTIAEVEMSRLEKPHVRQIVYVAARPTAPPPGSRLPTADPATLTISACQ
ncbi:hypothetical protein [Nostocoides sp. HKS02]|uniref:hypothetical protein n=1 Tax=Nostocoides sp. HKS02 TaxID=1813880 RepID=UPI001E496F9B|nr:hypothetical protein [Tetrasphaera sp. HKS02]